MSESESESEVNEMPLLPSTPPPPTVRTVDDEDISDSEISEFSYEVKTKYFIYNGRRFRKGDMADQEHFLSHCKRYRYQFDKSDGFDINWDEFDYLFICRPATWLPPIFPEKSNEELIHELTLYAIEEHNKESGENLEFVEHVKANFLAAAGYVFFVTFRARDLSSPNAESKLYQTKVRKFAKIIDVVVFRQKPTDEEMAFTPMDPPAP